MRDELLAALAAQEETLEVGGRVYQVREIETAADASAFLDDTDLIYKLAVRCVFEDGKQVFTDEDIPALKKSAKAKAMPLLQAVRRVNGLEAGVAEKKSEAGSPAE